MSENMMCCLGSGTLTVDQLIFLIIVVLKGWTFDGLEPLLKVKSCKDKKMWKSEIFIIGN